MGNKRETTLPQVGLPFPSLWRSFLNDQTHIPSCHPSKSNSPPRSVDFMLPSDCKKIEVFPRGLRTYISGCAQRPTVPALATSI